MKSGNVGLALSQGLILVNMVQYGVKQATEVVSQMTSVERLVQFTSLPLEKTAGPDPPTGWPQRARLIFKDLYLRYDKDSDPVLKNLNVVIESGWKVQIELKAPNYFLNYVIFFYFDMFVLHTSSILHLLHSYKSNVCSAGGGCWSHWRRKVIINICIIQIGTN